VIVVIAGLLTAVLYGAGDFCGGLASKRAAVLQVVAGSHAVGLVGIVAFSLVVGSRPGPADLVLGAAGGALGGGGVTLLYRRLAEGPMQVVAPLTGLVSAVVPAGWGLAIGERLSATAGAGGALGLVAILLVSLAAPPGATSAPVTVRVVFESLLAGAGFGGFFIFLDATDASSTPWPIAGARLLTTVVLMAALAGRRQPIVPPTAAVARLIVAAGLLDVGANASFLHATNNGLLTVASVLSSLYPVVTALLARIVLAERISSFQRWGFVAAMAGTTLIALG
jgi:drug/metabolite transporter (DMT)-like permease